MVKSRRASYERRFFERLARQIARRTGNEQGRRNFYFSSTRPVTVVALWNAMREAVAWLSRQRLFTPTRSYDDPAQILTPGELALDLLELAAWRAGLNGLEVRMGRRFPANAYQRELICALYFAFCHALFEEEGFGKIFEEVEPKNPTTLVEQALRAPDWRTRVEAYKPLRDKISVAALELMDDVMAALDPVERAALCEFLDEVWKRGVRAFITRAVIWRLVCEFVAAGQGCCMPAAVAFPPFFAVAPRSKRPAENPRDDLRPIPRA